MQTIDVNHSKSFATEANLMKATAKLDSQLDVMRARGSFRTGHIRKLIIRNAEGRWTAAYHLTGDALSVALAIVGKGFLTIG
jgi:hypothetical protein